MKFVKPHRSADAHVGYLRSNNILKCQDVFRAAKSRTAIMFAVEVMTLFYVLFMLGCIRVQEGDDSIDVDWLGPASHEVSA